MTRAGKAPEQQVKTRETPIGTKKDPKDNLIEGAGFARDSPLEGTGFEPSVPRRDGIFETAPLELSGTAPSVRRAGSFARESKGSNPTSLGHLKEAILQMIVRWVGV